MPTGADGSRVQWFLCLEDGNGEIHATTPNFTPIRFNTSDLVRETSQIEDDEINPARQKDFARAGTYSLTGSITANLSHTSHDDMLEACLQGTWSSGVSATETTYSVADTDGSINDSGDGFITAGFAVGDVVTITGFTGTTANNVVDARITALTAGKMTLDSVSAALLVDESAGDSVTIAESATEKLDVGSTERQFALLRRNTDTSIDRIYRHCRVNSVGISAAINAAVGLNFGVLGTKAEAYTVPGGSTFDAATTTERMIPTIGYMKDARAALGYLSDYSVELTNNMEATFALFQREAYDISNGVFQASGSLSAYQEDTVLIDKLDSEETSDQIAQFQDPAGNAYRLILPRIKYTELSDPVSGPGKIIQGFSFGAGYDGTTTVRLERIDA